MPPARRALRQLSPSAGGAQHPRLVVLAVPALARGRALPALSAPARAALSGPRAAPGAVMRGAARLPVRRLLVAAALPALAVGSRSGCRRRQCAPRRTPPSAGSTLARSTVARTEVAAARIGDGAYVVGGFAAPDGATSAIVERYDLRRDRWARVRPIPQAGQPRRCGRPTTAISTSSAATPPRAGSPARRTRCGATSRARTAGAGCPGADRARSARGGRHRRPALRRRRRARRRGAADARDLRLRARALDAGAVDADRARASRGDRPAAARSTSSPAAPAG